MPFAGYKDFADCVAKNRDKSDPKAYCGSIQAKTEFAQVHTDFQPIIRNFLKAYCGDANSFCELGVSKYNAWKESKSLDDRSAYPQRGRQGSFAWFANLQPYVDKNGKEGVVLFKLLHPMCTLNRNCYSWDDIAYGIASLTGKPIDYAPESYDGHGDIYADWTHPQVVGEITFARPNMSERVAEGIGVVKNEIWQMVKSGEITGCSVVASSLGDRIDESGKHVYYPIFTRVALMSRSMSRRVVPGDPNSKVTVVEGVRTMESFLPIWESVVTPFAQTDETVRLFRFRVKA